MDVAEGLKARLRRDSELADDLTHSVILDQVELGVAVRMACLDALARSDGRA